MYIYIHIKIKIIIYILRYSFDTKLHTQSGKSVQIGRRKYNTIS